MTRDEMIGKLQLGHAVAKDDPWTNARACIDAVIAALRVSPPPAEPSSLVGLAVDAGEERKMLEMLRESGQSTLLANATVDRVVAVLRRVEHLEATPATPTPSPVPLAGAESARAWLVATKPDPREYRSRDGDLPVRGGGTDGYLADLQQWNEAREYFEAKTGTYLLQKGAATPSPVPQGTEPARGTLDRIMWLAERGELEQARAEFNAAVTHRIAALASPPPAQGTETNGQMITDLAALISNVLSVMGHMLNMDESHRLARAIAGSWPAALTAPVGETPEDGITASIDREDRLHCEKCQMLLPEHLGTYVVGVRAGTAWRCAACQPIEGPSGRLLREEVVRLRKLRLAKLAGETPAREGRCLHCGHYHLDGPVCGFNQCGCRAGETPAPEGT